MSNKSNGSRRERETAEFLGWHGFWATLLAPTSAGQPADIIAARGGRPYLIDSKDCRTGRFELKRMEPNQRMAMTAWRKAGNGEGLFALWFTDREPIFVPFDFLENCESLGVKSVSRDELINSGITVCVEDM